MQHCIEFYLSGRNMKIGEAPSVVKQVWSVLSGALRSKSSAVKGKAAHAMKSKVAVSWAHQEQEDIQCNLSKDEFPVWT